MRAVEIPGGTAFFREDGVDPIPGNSMKLRKAAARAAWSQLSEYPDLFTPGPAGETDEQREARLTSVKMRLTLEQSMAFDDVQEAAVIAMLHHWTLDRPLPTLATLGDEDYADVYEPLLEAVQEVSVPDELDTSVVPRKVGVSPDGEPLVPTGSSSSSSTTSEVVESGASQDQGASSDEGSD